MGLVLRVQDPGAEQDIHLDKRELVNMRMLSQDTGFYMLQDPLKWCGHTVQGLLEAWKK